MAKGDFKKAKGVLPWKEGDELPEHAINRFRDGGEDAKPYYYRKWGKAQADADRRLEFMRYVEKHKKVCMFCYTRYHTDDCRWAKELADAKK